MIACTADELSRLRTSYHSKDHTRLPVAAMVKSGEEALRQPVVFPSRGGQHNQWYQCDKCQIALKTVDATHHQCPKCKHIYTGEPYDDVIFSRVHSKNLKNLHATAWAYAVTDDPRFANFARQILLGYAERYQQYPYHSAHRAESNGKKPPKSGGHLFEQTLNEAWSLTTKIVPAYDLIHDAPVITTSDHERIRGSLLIPMLENIDKHKTGKGNWQTWHNAAMLWAGAVLRDDAWVTKAITEPANGFLRQMDISVTPDGMWYENSWGYHFYTLSAMVEIAEGARRLGIDLWQHPRFKAMFTLPVRYAMPNGSLPRFGDDVNTRLGGVRRYLEFAYQAYGDDSMLPYLVTQPTWDAVMFGRDTGSVGKPPALGSEVFAGTGHAILRSTGEKGLAAAMTFGPYGGFHGHFDKLSFVFFGLGTELAVDPGRAASQAYRLPIHRNWYKATLSHNTVLVGRRSQAGVSGALKTFVANETHAIALATCDDAYPGTRHKRLLLLTPSYLLVFDALDSETEQRFDWLYHSRGREVNCDAATTLVMCADVFPGSEYIANIRTGVSDNIIRVQFKDKKVVTHLTMVAEPKSEVLVGDGPGASVDDRVPMAMISRHGKQARFVAVLEPLHSIQPTTVTGVRIIERNSVIHLEVCQGSATDTIQLDDKHGVQLRRNDEVVLKSE
ncbi:MAG: heparinase II/III family protein [Kiritimatiellia bacterium]